MFYPVLAALVLAGCSNDEPGITPEEPNAVFEGDEAYITVCLADAGSGQSRATTENPGYEYGSTAEHNVSNAYFYFYDANGVFVAEGSAWNEEENPATTGSNIEFAGKNVVALKGLTKKNYPKYMVTVLNRPSQWATPGGQEAQEFTYSTLDEIEKALSSRIKDTDGNFVMSTTSWKRTTAQPRYFVTEVEESNFSLEPIDHASNSGNYVTVYVERLAAKVQLVLDATLPSVEIGGKKYYEIKATVGGDDNEGGSVAAENLYVDLIGWKLNATAKKSYVVKNLDLNWSDSQLGFAWNKPEDFRSFWGKSYNYGQDSYPENASGVSGSVYLDYFNLNDNLVAFGSSAYCAENTNTGTVVTADFPSAVTSILVKAKICGADGLPLDLVRFNGMLFRKNSFIEYILNVMKAKNLLNVWVETTPAGSADKTYGRVGVDYAELVHNGDGAVYVKLNVPAGTAMYSRFGQEGSYTYEPISDFSTVNANLKTESGDATGYKQGLMYYNIPIEHLNNTAVDDSGIPEAKYGVVRNHHYLVTINKLEKIGKGIYDPDEVIVPGEGDGGAAYYVGANIKVLSWKIVSQNVEL